MWEVVLINILVLQLGPSNKNSWFRPDTSQQLGRSISLLDLTLPLYFFQDVDGSTCAMNKGLTIDQWLNLDMKNNIHTY